MEPFSCPDPSVTRYYCTLRNIPKRMQISIDFFQVTNLMDTSFILYSIFSVNGRLQRVTIPEAVIIQFVLLKMSKVLLEIC